MLFEIFDDLFADHLALKATQGAFDRFVRIYRNKSHFVYSPPFGLNLFRVHALAFSVLLVVSKLILDIFLLGIATSLDKNIGKYTVLCTFTRYGP